jgi:alkylation response protein AidB-like acyl-CoA dehydrogenase
MPQLPPGIQRRIANSAPAQELSAFLDEALPAFEAQWGEDGRSFAARMDWQRRLNAAGWLAPGWPEEFGGRGLGVTDRVACDLALGVRKAPTPGGIIGLNNVGPTLQMWGTDAQRQHLPALRSGDELWCQGFSEPEAGSDLAGLRMTAVRSGGPPVIEGVPDGGGDRYIINGQKIWTSQGMEATHCELLVRTNPEAPKHKNLSVFLAPLDLPGIERRPLRQLDGGEDFAELFFTDVELPVDALLGPLDEGWRVATTTLMHERAGVITMAALLEADTLALIDRCAEQHTAMTPASRDDLIRSYIDARVLAIMAETSLAEAEVGGQPGPEQSIIKLSWSMLSQQVAATRMSIGGLDAVTNATEQAAASFLSSRASTIAGGTTDIMKNILAERVLGLPREPA